MLLIIIIFILSCNPNIVKPSFESKYSSEVLSDGRVKIKYLNGETFIGSLDKNNLPISGIVIDSKNNLPVLGMTESRGVFKVFNNKPSWCYEGDCYNGMGRGNYTFKKSKYKNIIPEKLEFDGIYKDYNEFKGVVHNNGNVYLEIREGKIYISSLTEEKYAREREEKYREWKVHAEVSKKYNILLNDCYALHEECRTDIQISYKDHQYLQKDIECNVNDYNQGRVSRGKIINLIEVKYTCTIRGTYQTIPVSSHIYINQKTGSCGPEYSYACR